MLDVLLLGFSIGCAGFLIGAVLTAPGEVLAWLPSLVGWMTRTRGKSPADWNALQYIVAKITYLCPKCISGQLAFWMCLFSLEGGFLRCFATVTLSIFFAWALERYYE